MHPAWSVEEYLPMEQSMQAEEELAPVTVEERPLAQTVHAEEDSPTTVE